MPYLVVLSVRVVCEFLVMFQFLSLSTSNFCSISAHIFEVIYGTGNSIFLNVCDILNFYIIKFDNKKNRLISHLTYFETL